MGQIINSVCLCVCDYLSVCLSVRTLMVAFLDRFSPTKSCTEVTTPKSKNDHDPFPYFARQNRHSAPKVLKIYANINMPISVLHVRESQKFLRR